MVGVLRFNPRRAVGHPLGVKPAGNMYLDDDVEMAGKRKFESLGFFASLTEELLVDVLGVCDATDLVKLSAASNYLRAYSFHTELWRDLLWAHPSVASGLVFKPSWRESYIATFGLRTEPTEISAKRPKPEATEPTSASLCRVRRVYSDLLFGPYRASGLEPTPQWLVKENIERVSFRDLSVEDFVSEFEKTNKPVIITDYLAENWVAYTEWRSLEQLVQRSGDPVMECGSVQMRVSEFAQYLGSGLSVVDEVPVFIFDTKSFGHSAAWQRDYSQIPYFGPDLFDLLENESRPDHRWLLVGGPGASSKWHVDPNSTNAWNAVITGAKKWILLPPHLGPPPGVEVSSDGFAVRQPATLTDWLDSGFYDELVSLHGPSGSNGLVEATCNAGETMFIPRGWWHCVRNVGDEVTIAVTQNYAAESSVTHVRRFLREMSHCVSGVPLNRRGKLWAELDVALSERRPELVAGIDIDALIAEADAEDDVASTGSCCGGEVHAFSFWDHFSTSSKNLSFER